MLTVIIGNICSTGGLIADIIGASRKKASQVLFFQCITQLFYTFSTIILGGYSAAVQNVVGIVRNIVAIKHINSKALTVILVALPVVLGIAVNTIGFVGLLPVIANLFYSVSVFRFHDRERPLKYCLLVNLVLFAVFNAFILNYVNMLSNIIVIITTTVSLICGRKRAVKPADASEPQPEQVRP